MLDIILKTKGMPVTFSGCAHAYLSSKTTQLGFCNIIHFKGASLL